MNGVDLFASAANGSLQLVRSTTLESDDYEALTRQGSRDVVARCIYDTRNGKWCVRCYETETTTPDTVETVMCVLESVVENIASKTGGRQRRQVPK